MYHCCLPMKCFCYMYLFNSTSPLLYSMPPFVVISYINSGISAMPTSAVSRMYSTIIIAIQWTHSIFLHSFPEFFRNRQYFARHLHSPQHSPPPLHTLVTVDLASSPVPPRPLHSDYFCPQQQASITHWIKSPLPRSNLKIVVAVR